MDSTVRNEVLEAIIRYDNKYGYVLLQKSTYGYRVTFPRRITGMYSRWLFAPGEYQSAVNFYELHKAILKSKENSHA